MQTMCPAQLRAQLGLLLLLLMPSLLALSPDAYGAEKAGLTGYRRGLQDRLLRKQEGEQEKEPEKEQEKQEQSYEERYTITIQPRSSSCFFLEDLQEGYTISVHYLVLSTRCAPAPAPCSNSYPCSNFYYPTSGGQQMDLAMTLRDPDRTMIPGAYKGRLPELHFRWSRSRSSSRLRSTRRSISTSGITRSRRLETLSSAS